MSLEDFLIVLKVALILIQAVVLAVVAYASGAATVLSLATAPASTVKLGTPVVAAPAVTYHAGPAVATYAAGPGVSCMKLCGR